MQSVLPKLLDKFVSRRIGEICVGSINRNQYGFVRNRSTLSNLLEYRVFLSEAQESGGQVDSVYTDYSKAFDRVYHGLLKGKLIKWGFPQESCHGFIHLLQIVCRQLKYTILYRVIFQSILVSHRDLTVAQYCLQYL